PRSSVRCNRKQSCGSVLGQWIFMPYGQRGDSASHRLRLSGQCYAASGGSAPSILPGDAAAHLLDQRIAGIAVRHNDDSLSRLQAEREEAAKTLVGTTVKDVGILAVLRDEDTET